ncbi:hypothetical protein J6590_016299 [Homalodisca vitripennis]|nr:hypothetical protein J6590_016299 [Homalodisca vitripennis]
MVESLFSVPYSLHASLRNRQMEFSNQINDRKLHSISNVRCAFNFPLSVLFGGAALLPRQPRNVNIRECDWFGNKQRDGWYAVVRGRGGIIAGKLKIGTQNRSRQIHDHGETTRHTLKLYQAIRGNTIVRCLWGLTSTEEQCGRPQLKIKEGCRGGAHAFALQEKPISLEFWQPVCLIQKINSRLQENISSNFFCSRPPVPAVKSINVSTERGGLNIHACIAAIVLNPPRLEYDPWRIKRVDGWFARDGHYRTTLRVVVKY